MRRAEGPAELSRTEETRAFPRSEGACEVAAAALTVTGSQGSHARRHASKLPLGRRTSSGLLPLLSVGRPVHCSKTSLLLLFSAPHFPILFQVAPTKARRVYTAFFSSLLPDLRSARCPVVVRLRNTCPVLSVVKNAKGWDPLSRVQSNLADEGSVQASSALEMRETAGKDKELRCPLDGPLSRRSVRAVTASKRFKASAAICKWPETM